MMHFEHANQYHKRDKSFSSELLCKLCIHLAGERIMETLTAIANLDGNASFVNNILVDDCGKVIVEHFRFVNLACSKDFRGDCLLL